MIEVEVHQQLRAFLRERGESYWPHHLTMGRLVARALRLDRSVLIQTGASATGDRGRYRLSYLVPLLLWPEPAILVATEPVQQQLLLVEIPQLQQWIGQRKPVRTGDRWPSSDFEGVLIVSPQAWLQGCLTQVDQLDQPPRFPAGIPVILDGADDLETWTRDQLTAQIQPGDWHDLGLACPDQVEAIREARVQLTREIFQHPINPYECYLLELAAQEILQHLYQQIPPARVAQLPPKWFAFWQRLQTEDCLSWVTVARPQGQFSLYCGPAEVASILEPVWAKQPVVLIGTALDLEPGASLYRQRLGLGEITSLKFSLDRHNELIQLYLPDGLPLPNTPQYQAALVRQFQSLLHLSSHQPGLAVLVIGDVPLKAQVASMLAAEFGSRVQVERTELESNAILITGWEFWRKQQAQLPCPQLLAIATLPIPSLEYPLVAGRVAYHKRLRQDWFRLYLLPEALNELQRAIAPVRESQGVVALFDSRVLHRSYGNQVLAALSPLARINYLDPELFSKPNCSIP